MLDTNLVVMPAGSAGLRLLSLAKASRECWLVPFAAFGWFASHQAARWPAAANAQPLRQAGQGEQIDDGPLV